MSVDHYKILEVRRDAPAEDIQRAYRAFALRYHPDRNPSPDAVSKMSAINEAWAVLGDPVRRREYDASIAKPRLHPEFAAAILSAARDVVMRGGWRVVESHEKALILEQARQRVRVVFLDRLDNALLLGLARQSAEPCVVLALRIEGPVGPCASAIDLLHSTHFGAPLPEGPARSLFAAFL
jgi:DnaJ-domain-containing protein 1